MGTSTVSGNIHTDLDTVQRCIGHPSAATSALICALRGSLFALIRAHLPIRAYNQLSYSDPDATPGPKGKQGDRCSAIAATLKCNGRDIRRLKPAKISASPGQNGALLDHWRDTAIESKAKVSDSALSTTSLPRL